MQKLINFLEKSYTAYHAVDNAKKILVENGFTALSEREDWNIQKGGKYFVDRESALIAFTVGNMENCSFSIIASHLDSPALKVKRNPFMKTEGYYKLNVEKYGGGILYSLLDRPLKLAGRIIVETEEGTLTSKTCVSDYSVSIPSLAIHMNRNVNDGLSLNAQVDMCPLFCLANGDTPNLFKGITEENVVDYDLFVVNTDPAFYFGANQEFIASPRVDNLTSAYASLNALVNSNNENGIKVIALFDSEEIGNQTTEGAASDFLDRTLKRTANALGLTETQFDQAIAKSFFLSLDVAHAVHPNHPEKHDPTNRPMLGDGIVIKYNSNKAYITDSKSAAVLKTIFSKSGVLYQVFFNRSDALGGSTLGRSALTRTAMLGADIGLAQLAMHSATETFATSDYLELEKGLLAFFQTTLKISDKEISIN